MDTATSKFLPGYLRPLRPKQEVLLEEWGTLDENQIFRSNTAMQMQPPPLPPHQTWNKLKLPYIAPSCPPLPSYSEVVSALETNSLKARNGLIPICRMGDTVVKCGPHADILNEAENILFLAEKCPQLRIPKILAVWTDVEPHGGVYYLFMMEFIEGIRLDTATFAELLPVHAQDIVCAKVSAQLRLLRSIPSEGYYGRVHRQGWLEDLPALYMGPAPTMSGPYNTYEEFVSAMFQSFEKCKAIEYHGDQWPPKLPAMSSELWSLIADCKPVEPKFTWPDPKPANIIVQPIKKDDGTEDWDVVLIDWECAGWCPAWVQAMQVELRFSAIKYDREKGPYDYEPYRDAELTEMMLKDFEPNPSWRILKEARKDFWIFFG